MSIIARVKSIIAVNTGIEENKITFDTDFAYDLGLDSLDIVRTCIRTRG